MKQENVLEKNVQSTVLCLTGLSGPLVMEIVLAMEGRIEQEQFWRKRSLEELVMMSYHRKRTATSLHGLNGLVMRQMEPVF